MLKVIIAFFVGAMFGVLVMSLMFVAGRDDELNGRK